MKNENDLSKLSTMFESLSNDNSVDLDGQLKEVGIDSTSLVEEGMKRIEGFKAKFKTTVETNEMTLLERALDKLGDVSSSFDEAILGEIKPLLLNSTNTGLQLFFQGIDEIEHQEELKRDSENMQKEIALFRLKENLRKNQLKR